MHLKQSIIALEDCFPYPLPPSQTLAQREKHLLRLRVLHYKETELQKIAHLGEQTNTSPDHLFLLPFHPAITIRRPYDEQHKLHPPLNQKVRRQN